MYVLDTNILVLAVRKAEIWQRVQTTLSLNSSNMLISIVSQGELYSLADQFGWGNSKQEQISHNFITGTHYSYTVRSIGTGLS